MKKHLFFSLLAVLALSFSACKKDDKDNSGGGNPTPNQKPVVTFTGPVGNVDAYINFTLKVNASDPDGSITKVKFYIVSGGKEVKMSEDLISPYESSETNIQPGQRTFYADAFDNNGDSTRAQIIITAVNNSAQ
jgi:hypothetical protein